MGVILTAVTISLFNINIKYLITFNATVFCTIFAYLIPAIMHLRCAYFPSRRTLDNELT